MRKFINTNNRGTTLVELMIIVSIMGVIFMVGPNLLKNTMKLWKSSESSTEVQQNARISLRLIESLLRHASNSSVVLTRHTSDAPPYSKVEFSIPSGDIYHFYQQDDKLWIYHLSPSSVVHNRVIAENLLNVSFGYPISTDETLLSVAICFQKGTYAKESKNFYLSTQRIKVMNL